MIWGEILKNSTVIQGIGWLYAERILAQLVSFTVSVILARLLDPNLFGNISIVMVFISICDSITIGGFGNALVQKKEPNNNDYNTIFCVSLAISIILYILDFLCNPI